jgi:hypothetical protein
MRSFGCGAQAVAMRGRSYAVWWSEDDGRRQAGKLELSPFHALLAGNPGSRLAVPLDDVAGVDYALGRLRLSRRRGAPICIGSLDAPGALLELADALRAGCALSGV